MLRWMNWKETPLYSLNVLYGVTYCKISIPLQPNVVIIGSGCCSVPAVLKMFSEDRNSTGAFLFFAFIWWCLFVVRKGYLFNSITGVALNISPTSAFDLVYCLLQSCLPHHPAPFTLLQLLSINKRLKKSSGSLWMWFQRLPAQIYFKDRCGLWGCCQPGGKVQ